MAKPTDLYRHYNADGDLLYVGISLSAVHRLSQHRCGASWYDQIARVDVTRFASRAEAAKAEADAIRTENPLYNKAGTGKPRERILCKPPKAPCGGWEPGVIVEAAKLLQPPPCRPERPLYKDWGPPETWGMYNHGPRLAAARRRAKALLRGVGIDPYGVDVLAEAERLLAPRPKPEPIAKAEAFPVWRRRQPLDGQYK